MSKFLCWMMGHVWHPLTEIRLGCWLWQCQRCMKNKTDTL